MKWARRAVLLAAGLLIGLWVGFRKGGKYVLSELESRVKSLQTADDEASSGDPAPPPRAQGSNFRG